MWALHKGRRTVGEELSWVGPCGARNPIGVPETGIDRATVANAEEHTTLLTRLMDAIASPPSSQRSDGRHGKVDPMRAASGARTGHFTRIRERSLSQSETGRV
jgi:hypothetical protein